VSDPKRWSNDPGALTPPERRAFAAGRRGHEAPPGAHQAVWEGLAATLAASSAAAAAGSGATGVTVAVAMKQLALGALLGAAVAGGAAVYQRASAPRPALSATSLAGSALAPAAEVHSNGAPTVVTPNEVLPAAQPGAALERSLGSSRPPAPAAGAREAAVPYGSGQASFPTGAADASDTAESRRLLAARSLLRSGRASAALSALASIRADFPEGSLAQEREALTIEALLAFGDRAAARARAAAFLARYPESPHVDAVRKALK
jgi:hypothetical protein